MLKPVMGQKRPVLTTEVRDAHAITTGESFLDLSWAQMLC